MPSSCCCVNTQRVLVAFSTDGRKLPLRRSGKTEIIAAYGWVTAKPFSRCCMEARMFRTLQTIALALLLFPALGCGDNSEASPDAKIQVEDYGKQPGGSSDRVDPIELTADETRMDSPAAQFKQPPPEVIVHTSHGDIRIKLFDQEAPQTVSNFLENYVDRDCYRDTLVHYVKKDYMMIAGGYTSAYEEIPVRAPVIYEGGNGLSNRRGTVAMNRLPEFKHSGTTQFFFNLVDNEFLNHVTTEVQDGSGNAETPGYCVFGEIVEGIEVMDTLGATQVVDKDGFPSTPVEPLVITSIERIR